MFTPSKQQILRIIERACARVLWNFELHQLTLFHFVSRQVNRIKIRFILGKIARRIYNYFETFKWSKVSASIQEN